jgi:hypothetical protein
MRGLFRGCALTSTALLVAYLVLHAKNGYLVIDATTFIHFAIIWFCAANGWSDEPPQEPKKEDKVIYV